MPSFVEFFIACDIADCVGGAGQCTHAATNQNPFHMCSIAFGDLSRFDEEKAQRLEILPISVIDSDNDDFELIAGLINAIKGVMKLDHSDRNPLFYTFAKAKRLNLALLVKQTAPHTGLCQTLAPIFGVQVVLVQ